MNIFNNDDDDDDEDNDNDDVHVHPFVHGIVDAVAELPGQVLLRHATFSFEGTLVSHRQGKARNNFPGNASIFRLCRVPGRRSKTTELDCSRPKESCIVACCNQHLLCICNCDTPCDLPFRQEVGNVLRQYLLCCLTHTWKDASTW